MSGNRDNVLTIDSTIEGFAGAASSYIKATMAGFKPDQIAEFTAENVTTIRELDSASAEWGLRVSLEREPYQVSRFNFRRSLRRLCNRGCQFVFHLKSIIIPHYIIQVSSCDEENGKRDSFMSILLQRAADNRIIAQFSKHNGEDTEKQCPDLGNVAFLSLVPEGDEDCLLYYPDHIDFVAGLLDKLDQTTKTGEIEAAIGQTSKLQHNDHSGTSQMNLVTFSSTANQISGSSEAEHAHAEMPRSICGSDGDKLGQNSKPGEIETINGQTSELHHSNHISTSQMNVVTSSSTTNQISGGIEVEHALVEVPRKRRRNRSQFTSAAAPKTTALRPNSILDRLFGTTPHSDAVFGDQQSSLPASQPQQRNEAISSVSNDAGAGGLSAICNDLSSKVAIPMGNATKIQGGNSTPGPKSVAAVRQGHRHSKASTISDLTLPVKLFNVTPPLSPPSSRKRIASGGIDTPAKRITGETRAPRDSHSPQIQESAQESPSCAQEISAEDVEILKRQNDMARSFVIPTPPEYALELPREIARRVRVGKASYTTPFENAYLDDGCRAALQHAILEGPDLKPDDSLAALATFLIIFEPFVKALATEGEDGKVYAYDPTTGLSSAVGQRAGVNTPYRAAWLKCLEGMRVHCRNMILGSFENCIACNDAQPDPQRDKNDKSLLKRINSCAFRASDRSWQKILRDAFATKQNTDNREQEPADDDTLGISFEAQQPDELQDFSLNKNHIAAWAARSDIKRMVQMAKYCGALHSMHARSTQFNSFASSTLAEHGGDTDFAAIVSKRRPLRHIGLTDCVLEFIVGDDDKHVQVRFVPFSPDHYLFSRREFSRSDMVDASADVKSDNDNFWKSMFEGNKDARDYYYALTWTALLSDEIQQADNYQISPGRSGKSLGNKFLEGMFPHVEEFPNRLLVSEEELRKHLLRLEHTRIIYRSEMPDAMDGKDQRINTDTYKKFLGMGKFVARNPYGRQTKNVIIAAWKLCESNVYPYIETSDEADIRNIAEKTRYIRYTTKFLSPGDAQEPKPGWEDTVYKTGDPSMNRKCLNPAHHADGLWRHFITWLQRYPIRQIRSIANNMNTTVEKSTIAGRADMMKYQEQVRLVKDARRAGRSHSNPQARSMDDSRRLDLVKFVRSMYVLDPLGSVTLGSFNASYKQGLSQRGGGTIFGQAMLGGVIDSDLYLSYRSRSQNGHKGAAAIFGISLGCPQTPNSRIAMQALKSTKPVLLDRLATILPALCPSKHFPTIFLPKLVCSSAVGRNMFSWNKADMNKISVKILVEAGRIECFGFVIKTRGILFKRPEPSEDSIVLVYEEGCFIVQSGLTYGFMITGICDPDFGDNTCNEEEEEEDSE